MTSSRPRHLRRHTTTIRDRENEETCLSTMVPVALCPHFLYFHSFTSAPVPHCPPLYLCSLLLPFTSTLFSTFYCPLFCPSSQFSLLSLVLPQLFPVLTFSLAHIPITSVFFLPPLLTLFPIFSMILSPFLPSLSPCSLFSPTSLLFPGSSNKCQHSSLLTLFSE